MFKTFKTTILLFLIVGTNVHAQQNNGMAKYKIRLADVQDDLQPFLKSLEPALDNLTYILKFTEDQSIYSVDKTMDIDMDRQQEAARIVGGKGVYFHEVGKELMIQREFMGDFFLIQSDLGAIEWEITDEKRKKGQFECLKAFGVKKGPNGKESEIVAWFSTEINAPYGPKEYFGLPGLIMEVEDKGVIYYCATIHFGKQHIEKPSRGIRITEEKLNEYVLKKAAEEFGYKN